MDEKHRIHYSTVNKKHRNHNATGGGLLLRWKNPKKVHLNWSTGGAGGMRADCEHYIAPNNWMYIADSGWSQCMKCKALGKGAS